MAKTLVAFALGLTLAAAPVRAADQAAGVEADWPKAILELRNYVDRFPNNAQARQSLAVAYNNYAVVLADKGDLPEAARQLEEAVRLDPANTQLKQNLSMMHVQRAQDAYRAHRISQAKEAIQDAIRIDPDNADAYALLGEVEYNSQRMKEAKAAWQAAVKLRPGFGQVTQRLAQLNEEMPVESGLERISQVYFDIRFPDSIERSAGFDLQERLSAARRSVGSDFGYWPNRKIVVLVYSAAQFRQLRKDAPEWAGGQYDGKIRVPLPSLELGPDKVGQILTHEYTHAVVYDVTGNRCPVWLNEGLAEYEAWKGAPLAWQILPKAASQGRLMPWAQLFASGFSGLSNEAALLAYEQSHSIVRFLVERYGFWRIKHLLQTVKQGTPAEQALVEEFRLKLPRLEENWRTWLQDSLR